MQNSGPKIYPKNGSFCFFLVIQKLRRKYPVDHRHNYIKVSPLRSPTNFKKDTISITLYKLIYFCSIDKKGLFHYIKYQFLIKIFLKTICNFFFGENTLHKVFWATQNKLKHINSAQTLSKFCLYKFSPKLNPICPVNLNQHCIRELQINRTDKIN